MFLGSATQTVKEHFRLEPHLSAVNAAIRDLRSLQASQCASPVSQLSSPCNVRATYGVTRNAALCICADPHGFVFGRGSPIAPVDVVLGQRNREGCAECDVCTHGCHAYRRTEDGFARARRRRCGARSEAPSTADVRRAGRAGARSEGLRRRAVIPADDGLGGAAAVCRAANARTCSQISHGKLEMASSSSARTVLSHVPPSRPSAYCVSVL